MLIEKKEIDIDVAAPILAGLHDAIKVKKVVSLGKFVTMNFDFFSRSGGSIKQIYEYLKAGGLDVGTYNSFRNAFNRAKKQRIKTPLAVTNGAGNINVNTQKREGKDESNKAINAVNTVKGEERKNERPQAQVSKYNPALPPVFLPGGVEAYIDPNTGGKLFEIE